jgi:hypothetical protein
VFLSSSYTMFPSFSANIVFPSSFHHQSTPSFSPISIVSLNLQLHFFFSFTKAISMLLLKRLRWEKWLIPLTNIVTFLKGLIEIVLSNDLWRNRTATITLLQMQRTMEIVFVWLLKWEMADNGFSFGFDIVVNSLAKFILQFLFYL